MSKSRRDYFRRTRKVRLRDLHHSKAGWMGLAAGLASFVMFWISVILSYANGGDAKYYVGALGLIGLVLAVGGLVMSVMGAKEEGARPITPRIGVAVCVVMMIMYAVLYICGGR